MKKILFYATILAGLFIYTSCEDYLDITPTEDMTLDEVFQQRNNAESFLTSIYWSLPYEMNISNYWGSNPFVAASDEMDQPYANALPNFMNSGTWAPDAPETTAPGQECLISYTWTNPYEGLRKANIFLENIHKVPMDEKEKAQWTGEVTFFRAFFHFCLFRIYGPIPLMNHYYDPDADFSQTQRSSVEECVAFILKDCEDAAALLPIKADSPDKYGRPTKASVLALKSRLLLYAASPFWNGNTDYANFTDYNGKPFFPQTYDKHKWKVAADAALTAINELEAAGYGLYNKQSDPYENYKQLFLDRNNSEVLFVRNMGAFAQIEQVAGPRGMGGWSGLCPTQELFDAYQMSDGSDPILGYNPDGSPIINPESGYSEDGFTESSDAHPKGYYPGKIFKMYYDREPRFYASNSYSQCMWRGRRLDFRNGRTDGRATGPDYTTTGYLMRKFLDEKGVSLTQPLWTLKTWIYFRLGEIYLNYAEAINEWEGPANAYPYVNAIRNRAGLPSLESGLSTEEMRKKIQHERRIELAYETHRFFDCHRWKTAHQIDSQPIHGMNISGKTDDVFYQRTKVEDRVFISPKHYLFPIPQAEINKNRENLIQNPGWEPSSK